MTKKLKKRGIRIIIALILFFIVFIADKIIGLATLIDSPHSWLLALALYLGVYFYIAYDVLWKAIRNIANGQVFDENFLMCVATIGAFGLGIYRGVQISKGNPVELEGLEEGCAVILFYQVGEWFQSYAVGKSRKSITALMDIRPDYANLLRDGVEEMVSPDEVNVDDIIIIKPGEKIPLDGVIIEGNTTVDAKALTGESIPQELAVDNNVISGCVNLTSTIKVKVTKAFYDSTVSKILDLVENATSKKSTTEAFITKFAKYYTPIVVFLALGVAILPPLGLGVFAGEWNHWSDWIYRALAFLVVSCPCALVISVPLSFFAGIGKASRVGVLIKGSNYLEQFNNANVFVFDKTGTLTKGNFAVTKVTPEEKREEILALASIAEHDSSHPIARSIVNAYGKAIEGGYSLTNIAGHGVVANNGNVNIYCGNAKLMKENNINYIEETGLGTVVYVARNNEFIGSILISDEIKEESKQMIADLNKMGAKTVMLTGDNEAIAHDVATKLGVTEYKSSLLPQDKVTEVESLLNSKKEKDILCFVGDGINDAPVLMRSDIGIAMGGVGSDAAIEASDIVLMNDDLRGISEGKKIARKTMRIVMENIFFALGVKVLIMVLSLLNVAPGIMMWIAVFGDVGVSVLCILNAMRVNSKK